MTFANLSLTKAPESGAQIPQGARGPRAWHRSVFGRRMWALGLTILYLVVCYPIGTAMIIQRANYQASLQALSATAALSQRLYEVSRWIGIRQNFWWVLILLGVFLGIEGYSYLFSMVQMDFYESQPMPRRRRFMRVYVNGVLIFLIPFVICYALSILIAAAMGSMTGILLAECLVAAVRLLVAFLASYNIAIFAVMLSGNAGIATIVAAILHVAECIYHVTFQALAQTFYATYYYGSAGRDGRTLGDLTWFWLTPLYRMIDEQEIITQVDHYRYIPYTATTLGQALRQVLPSTACMLGVGVLFLLAAYGLYLRRRSETAGGTVIYEIARFVLKMIVAIGAALYLGITVYYGICSELSGSRHVVTALTLAFMLATVVILCGIIQAIYDMNARRCAGRLWHMLIAGVVVSVVFAIYRYDLTGYDRYLPAVSEVEYGALVDYNNGSYLFDDPANSGQEISGDRYSQNYMQIHDIYTLLQIAQIGQETLVEQQDSDNGSVQYGWNCGVVYTLKDGRQVARALFIPEDIDSTLMDQIVGSDDYKKGQFSVYQENNTIIRGTQDRATLSYTNGVDQENGDGTLYAAFAEAYRKDLALYNYTYASTHEPIGAVLYQSRADDQYYTATYEVYADYANTIAFLKANGLFEEALEVSGTVASIEIDYYGGEQYVSRTYTDADQIRQILEATCSSAFTSAWSSSSAYEQSYNIWAYSANSREDPGYGSRMFKAGQVPAFVLQDLGVTDDGHDTTGQGAVTVQTIDVIQPR